MVKQLSEKSIQKIGQEIATHHLVFVVLFGSVAHGNGSEGSDIDIAVLRKDRKPLSYSQFREIINACSEVLAGSFSKIDLVDLATANILLRYEITAEGMLLFGNGEEYENYRIFALRDYRDANSLRRLEELLIEKRQGELHARIHA